MRDAKGFDYLWWTVTVAEVAFGVTMLIYFMRAVGT